MGSHTGEARRWQKVVQKHSFFFSRRGHFGQREKERRDRSVSELKRGTLEQCNARAKSDERLTLASALVLALWRADDRAHVRCEGAATSRDRPWADGRQGPTNSVAPSSLKFVLARAWLSASIQTNCIRCGATLSRGKTRPPNRAIYTFTITNGENCNDAWSCTDGHETTTTGMHCGCPLRD